MTDRSTAQINKAFQEQNWATVVQLCEAALKQNSRHLRANQLLGYALDQLRKPREALAAYASAAARHPGNAELLANYAALLHRHGMRAEAVRIQDKVCAMRPNHPLVWIKLSEFLYPLRQHKRGAEAADKALVLAQGPDQRYAALTLRAKHRRELGLIDEAIQDCEAAIALNAKVVATYSSRLLYLLSSSRVTAQQLTAAAREYAAIVEAPLKSTWPDHAERREGGPWRRLRVGFISPDFRAHPVMNFVEGLLARLDRRQFEVWAFHLHPAKDEVTQRVRCHADHFVVLTHFKPAEQARAVQEARIDILVDLAGHSGDNALQALARKPAPVQVSTIGYPGTTGLTAVDGWLSDDISDPPGAEALYSERLYRLPTRWTCYRPHMRHPLWRYRPDHQVRPTPALQNGFITFGSCNSLSKLTDEVLTTWGRILAAVPTARLLIKGQGLDQSEFEQEYRARCACLGIDTARLDLLPTDALYYLTYHQIDIALDPYPFGGGTTTNDLLWMGVPLVTLAGDSLRARMSLGSLAHLGHHDWIARDVDEYVGIATRLAQDVEALNRVRLRLREEMEASTLMREDVYVSEVGQALRRMWMRWLAESVHPDGSPEQVAAQIDAWWSEGPPEAEPDPPVGIAPGVRIPLSQAYAQIQSALQQAEVRAPAPQLDAAREMDDPHWRRAVQLAEQVLHARPQDPVALTALAAADMAHGRTETGQAYLVAAQQAMAPAEASDQLLARTRDHVRAALRYLGEED